MKVLVVTTSNAYWGGDQGRPTGVWLDEYTLPYMEFLRAGVTVASPKGGQMPVDARTLPDGLFDLSQCAAINSRAPKAWWRVDRD